MYERNKYIINSFAKLLLLFLIIAFSSCRKVVSYPPEPEISFSTGEFLTATDDLGNTVLYFSGTLYFTDGDGDIGWAPSSENSMALRPCSTENTHDLYVNMYEKINGIFYKRNFNSEYICENDTLKNLGENSLNANLPFMKGRGQSNSLIGDIKYDIELPITLRSDTIKFDFVLVDRAENYSNVEESPQYLVPRLN